MPASTVLSSIRTPLASALAGVSANVYSYVPEAVQVPAVIIIPNPLISDPLRIRR